MLKWIKDVIPEGFNQRVHLLRKIRWNGIVDIGYVSLESSDGFPIYCDMTKELLYGENTEELSMKKLEDRYHRKIDEAISLLTGFSDYDVL